MKAKTKVLWHFLLPIAKDAFKRVHHQKMLTQEFLRRMNWREDVLMACDNYKEMFPTGCKLDYDLIIFPSPRCLTKNLGTLGFYSRKGFHCFHIIRQGKRKWRIVKAKKNKRKSFMRTVEYIPDKGYFCELGGEWHYMDCRDFGCDTCDEFGLCRTGHHDKSFCGIARSLGFTLRGNTWFEVTDDEKSLAVLNDNKFTEQQ